MAVDNTPAEEVDCVDPLLELAQTRFLANTCEDESAKQAHLDVLLKDIEANGKPASCLK